MQYIDRSDLPNEQAPLDGGSSLAFNVKYILHCKFRLDMAVDTATGERAVKFGRDITAYQPHYPDIDGFIRELLQGHIKAPVYTPTPYPPANGGPFDIGVDDLAFVVIELDRGSNWIFSQKKIAITKKSSAYADEDGPVFHVRPSDGQAVNAPVADEDVRIVYFEILRRRDDGPRLFDFNVRFVENGYATETVIDPDIPNTGQNPTIPYP